jgi:hypothetical protein
MNEAKNVIENLGVARLLLETHELDVDDVETLVRLRDKFPEQIVHGNAAHDSSADPPPFSIRKQCVREAFNFGCRACPRRPR